MTMQRDEDGYGIFESDPPLTAGNLQIIACAGSGKTEFVSARIAYMVSRGIARPGNVYKECRVLARAHIIGPFRKMPDEPAEPVYVPVRAVGPCPLIVGKHLAEPPEIVHLHLVEGPVPHLFVKTEKEQDIGIHLLE